MLVAQILSLLYNIVDRIYIARIPDIGTTALGAVGLCFPIIVIITAFSNPVRKRRCTALFRSSVERAITKCLSDHAYFIFHADALLNLF